MKQCFLIMKLEDNDECSIIYNKKSVYIIILLLRAHIFLNKIVSSFLKS